MGLAQPIDWGYIYISVPWPKERSEEERAHGRSQTSTTYCSFNARASAKAATGMCDSMAHAGGGAHLIVRYSFLQL